jgi:hypothetical protein
MLSAGGGNATCYSRHWFHLFLLYVLAREYSVRGLVCVCSALGIAEGEAALALAPAVRTTTVRTVLATCSSILLGTLVARPRSGDLRVFFFFL